MKSDAQIEQDDPAYEPRRRSPRRAVTVSDYAQKMAAQEAAYRVAGGSDVVNPSRCTCQLCLSAATPTSPRRFGMPLSGRRSFPTPTAAP